MSKTIMKNVIKSGNIQINILAKMFCLLCETKLISKEFYNKAEGIINKVI